MTSTREIFRTLEDIQFENKFNPYFERSPVYDAKVAPELRRHYLAEMLDRAAEADLDGECHEHCVSGRVHAVSDTQASKYSPNIMANWLRAANRSRTFRPSFSNLRMAS